jgi:hypothetical protein
MNPHLRMLRREPFEIVAVPGEDVGSSHLHGVGDDEGIHGRGRMRRCQELSGEASVSLSGFWHRADGLQRVSRKSAPLRRDSYTHLSLGSRDAHRLGRSGAASPLRRRPAVVRLRSSTHIVWEVSTQPRSRGQRSRFWRRWGNFASQCPHNGPPWPSRYRTVEPTRTLYDTLRRSRGRVVSEAANVSALPRNVFALPSGLFTVARNVSAFASSLFMVAGNLSVFACDIFMVAGNLSASPI